MADEKDSLPPPPPGYSPAPTLPPPPTGYSEAPSPGLMESFLRGAAEGATFGFDDKLGMSKEAREASRKANPWTHFLGEVAGGVAPMAAAAVLPTGAGQAAAAGRGAQLAARGAGLVRSALVPGEINTLGQAAYQGGKLGAVVGGLSGAGHADVKDDDSYFDAAKKRLGEGVLGSLTGAVIGAPLGAAGHGIYRGAEYLGGLKAAAQSETDAGRGALTTALKGLERDKIKPDELIAAIRSEFPDNSAAAGVANRFWGPANVPVAQRGIWTADMVEDVVRRAGAGQDAATISASLQQKLGGKGPGPDTVQTLLDELAARHLGPMTIIDRAANTGRAGSGENTQWTMRAAAATPGEPKAIAREQLLDRQLNAGTRIQDFMQRVLGTSDFDTAMAKHETTLANSADRMYAAARAAEQPFDLNPIFNKWEAKFNNMRGPIPDSVMGAINSMRSTQPVLNQAGNLAKQPAGGIVNKAPPMDLDGFIYARQGLFDAKEAAAKRGEKGLARELGKLYDDISKEVASTNPVWKEANDFFRDGAIGLDAGNAGAKMSMRLNNQNRENLKEFASAVTDQRKAKTELSKANAALKSAQSSGNQTAIADAQIAVDRLQAKVDASEARQELFKIGLMRSISDRVANQGETHNLTKELLLPGAQKMLRQVLGKDADAVIKQLKAEAAMHRTYSSQFGSQTTPLREHVDELNWAPNFEAAWSNLGLGKIMQLAQEKAAQYINVKRNTELMKLYTEMDPLKQIEFLEAMKNLQTVRQDWGNKAAKPAISAGSGILPSHEVAVDAERRHPTPVMPVFKQKP